MNGCERLQNLMTAQRAVIDRHLDEHKWCNHIEDRQQAVAHFIKKYGWIIRETFCEECEEYMGHDCPAYQEYLRKK